MSKRTTAKVLLAKRRSFRKTSRIVAFAKVPSVRVNPRWLRFRSAWLYSLVAKTRCWSLCKADDMVIGLQLPGSCLGPDLWIRIVRTSLNLPGIAFASMVTLKNMASVVLLISITFCVATWSGPGAETRQPDLALSTSSAVMGRHIFGCSESGSWGRLSMPVTDNMDAKWAWMSSGEGSSLVGGLSILSSSIRSVSLFLFLLYSCWHFLNILERFPDILWPLP